MPGAAPKKATQRPRPPIAPAHPEAIVVSPQWILATLGGLLLLGLLCAYLSLCALFYYGQWQLVLHPSRDLPQTPVALGLPFSQIHFAVDPSGQPQLDGWWIPSQLPTDPTVLLLHDGSGSMSDSLADAQLLHNARLNVFLFDYRGFGHSAGKHPTEASMEADARSAFAYLTEARAISPASVLVFGRGLGGSLGTLLCTEHPAVAALVLFSPNGDLETRVVTSDSRSRMVPVRLLFNEQFPLADRLHSLRTPKLLITPGTGNTPLDLQRAADPKVTLEAPPSDPAAVTRTLRRFLDSYLTRPPAELTPKATP